MKKNKKSPEDSMWSPSQVIEKYNISLRTLNRWVKDGRFPKPVSISKRSRRWKLSDLKEYDKTLDENEIPK